ncbi:unnamed protein product [Caenorhabditis bovis]|uniref:Uncharacterized protein n=1 Tax=Caenorhabditis bovis TaxID=2654633 RepID=A0A8S1EFZ7_9PELO|nr:unnamed protein product [Caenorhabditis bovis]
MADSIAPGNLTPELLKILTESSVDRGLTPLTSVGIRTPRPGEVLHPLKGYKLRSDKKPRMDLSEYEQKFTIKLRNLFKEVINGSANKQGKNYTESKVEELIIEYFPEYLKIAHIYPKDESEEELYLERAKSFIESRIRVFGDDLTFTHEFRKIVKPKE